MENMSSHLFRFCFWMTFLTLANSMTDPSTEHCEDSSKLCVQYKKYCSGNILKACKRTCNMCPPISYKGRCEDKNSGCEQLCMTEDGTVTCQCLNGYRLNADKKTCSDIDECSMNVNLCNTTNRPNCINTRGSYFCSEETQCSLNEGFANYYKSKRCCKLKQDECGQNSVNVGRIFGGEKSLAGRWPWMGRLERYKTVLCGVTLISLRWGVTAAHCLGFDPSEYTAIFGDIWRRDEEGVTVTYRQTRGIDLIISHEEFLFPKHDIALVRLDSAVIKSDYVSPACLPDGEVPEPGSICWATGFGKTSYTEQKSNYLMEVDLEVASFEECMTLYGRHNVITDQMICAGYKQGGKDTCYGDSGGPLICQRCSSCSWYLAGVTSFGRGCAEPGIYGVYTHVASHEEWIRRHVGMRLKGCGGEEGAAWSPWSPFTPCNATCGKEGTKSRYQECNGTPDISECRGRRVEHSKCSGSCGSWEGWQPWQPCTTSCGGGTQVRRRKCVGGNEGVGGCQGYASETRDCNTKPCSELEPHRCSFVEVDKVPNCDEVAQWCEGQFESFMDASCQMTCCFKSALNEKEKPSPCADNPDSESLCENYKEECANKEYGNYFKENCKKTCGFCGN